MTIFDKILEEQSAPERTLGNPLGDPSAIERRINFFSFLTKGKGYRKVSEGPKKNAQGKTRGERKREMHERTWGHV